MEWGINLEFNKRKFNLNKKLIFYLALTMIAIIIIMAVSINLTVENKFLYHFNITNDELLNSINHIRDIYLRDINNVIIGISLIMIIVVISISVFLSQQISKPIIVVSK